MSTIIARRLILLWMVIWIQSSSASTNRPSNLKPKTDQPPFEDSSSASDLFSNSIHSYDARAGRSKRNATPPDNLKYLLDRTSTIARLANGISLQSGLMNGSIPIDSVASELLNLGSVKISSIELNQIISFVQKLKALTSIDSSKLEKEINQRNQLRIKSESVKPLPDLTKYLSALKSFPFGQFQTAYQKLDSITKTLNTIEKIGKDAKNAEKVFSTLPTTFKSAFDALTKLKSMVTNQKVLEDASSLCSPIETILSLMNNRLSMGNQKIDSDSVSGSFELIEELKSLLLNGSSVDILKLREMVDSRTNTFKNKKTFTYGFGNGVSDVIQLDSDIMDPWLKSISGPNVSIQMLSNGLFPLFQLGKQLNEIDGKLKSLSSSDDSMNYLSDIVEKINSFPNGSTKFNGYFGEIESCSSKGSRLDKNVIDGRLGRIGKMKELDKWFKGIGSIDPTKYKKVMDDFIESLGFTDIQDATKSAKEVVGVLAKIKGNGKLTGFKKSIENMKTPLRFDKKSQDAKDEILKNGRTIVFGAMNDEVDLYNCLKEKKSKFEEIVPALKSIGEFKHLGSSKIEKIEKVIEVIDTVSKDLQTVSSIPNEMKKQMRAEVGEINKMKNSKECSETIGLSVGLVRNAFEFQSIPIGDLQSADSYLKGVIDKMKNKKKKNEIIDSWGNHSEYISILQSSIQIIKNYGNTLQLNDQSTIPDYGSSLQKLSKIKDIQVDTKSTNLKLKALDLVPNESKLKNTRSILIHLNSMDLQFSSHSKQLQATQKAIQDLFGFFTKFSSKPVGANSLSQRNLIGTPENTEKKETDWMLIGLGTAGFVILVCTIIIAIIVYYRRRTVVDPKKIRKWVLAQMFPPGAFEEAFRYHDNEMKVMTIHAGKPDAKTGLEYLPARKHRDHVQRLCNPETALKHIKMNGKMMPIHANLVVCPSGRKFYATQAPMAASKKRDDTREDFWHMCMHDEIDFIIMLVRISEISGELYFAEQKNGILTFGRYEVKTVEVKNEFFDDIIRRLIQVKDTTGKLKTRDFHHYNYIGWPDMKPPTDLAWDRTLALLKQCGRSKKPTVVHCLSGIGRTMAFIGVQYISELVALKPTTDISAGLIQLRSARWDAIQTIRQCYWIQLTVSEKLDSDFNLGLRTELDEMHALAYEVCYHNKGPQEFLARREVLRTYVKQMKAAGKKPEPQREETENLGEVIPY